MKRRITIFVIILAICSFVFALSTKVNASEAVEKIEGKTYYMAPNGSSSNDGLSEANPKDFYSALEGLKAGDTLYALPGTYDCPRRITLTESGNAFSKISVIASSNEKTVFDFSKQTFDSTNRGVQIDGDYWYFYGIHISGAGDNGMYIAGNHNTIEMCEFYNNRDSGLQLGRGAGSDTIVSQWPSYNYIKNCMAYNNYDDETYGENADGFAAKLTVGYGNVFDGCIAFRNSDDGWDLYAKSDTGNVGTVIIINCIAFENGWLLDGSTTRDGDGIGFKLGGSSMEGDVIVKNCMAWNNRLHGFSDNSNPRTMLLYNCTAYNNSVAVANGTGSLGYSDGGSTNFNMARSNQSYNGYYGLLSYATNLTATNIDYEVGDDYLGSAAYSIFHVAKGEYRSITGFMDASSYEEEKIGTVYTGLNDNCFATVNWPYTQDQYPSLNSLLRNSDNSINVGDMLDIVDSKLLTFCNGSQIGAKLNKSSWDEYEHYEYTTPTLGSTQDEIDCLAAYDALEVMCNKEAVYQNMPIWINLNECNISWESSDLSLFSFGTYETRSFSNVAYVDGIVHRSSISDKQVTLTATITKGSASLTKQFVLTLKKDTPRLGKILGVEDVYIVDLYSKFTDPQVSVTNKNSYSDQTLKFDIDYGLKKTYEYAETNRSEFNKVSKVYTSVPGVYRVTYTIKSYTNENDVLNKSFLVYVVSPTNEIDFVDYKGYEFYVCRDGVHIIGELTNVSGKLYAYLSENATETAESVVNNGTLYTITSDKIDVLALNDNDGKYYIHVVVVNNGGNYTSQVYTREVIIQEISTCQEFYDFANSPTSSVTIYLLKNDIDFTNFTWTVSSSTESLKGLLNGDGHTISNLTITSDSEKHNNIFYKLAGGTIMNIAFDHIKLLGDTAKSKNVAIVGQMTGGFLHNIKMTEITAVGFQTVGGLVGQVCGKENYVSQVSLVNKYEFDSNYKLKDGFAYFTVVTKYCGGIISNIQKDTAEESVACQVDNCYCDAYIGTGVDSGGYIGGIVGRIKNDLPVYTVSVRNCVFEGVVECLKNYTGGIVGGCESGAGTIYIIANVSKPVIIFGSTRSIIDGVTLDPYTGMASVAHKTGSPILGRYTAGTGLYYCMNNYGTFDDYNSAAGSSSEGDFGNAQFYRNLGFLTSIWQFDEAAQGIRLIQEDFNK